MLLKHSRMLNTCLCCSFSSHHHGVSSLILFTSEPHSLEVYHTTEYIYKCIITYVSYPFDDGRTFFFFLTSVSHQKSHWSHDWLSPHTYPKKGALLQLISFTRTRVLVWITFKTIFNTILSKANSDSVYRKRDTKKSLWITGPMLTVTTVLWNWVSLL